MIGHKIVSTYKSEFYYCFYLGAVKRLELLRAKALM